jgi:hypothetical protein
MYDLTAFTLNDMITCGADLRRLGDSAASMEETANQTVRYFYDHFRDHAGARATALVRFFITRPYDTLDAGLQQHVDQLLGGRPPADPLQSNVRLCSRQSATTLTGTAGTTPVTTKSIP